MTSLKIAAALLIAMMLPARAGELAGGFGLYIGKSYFNFDDLNTRLSKYGYAKASEKPITLGFDSYLIFGNEILLGFEYGHYSASAVGAGGSNSITGMKFFFYSGYSFYEREKWRSRLEWGIGLTDIDITLTRTQPGIEFDDVLEDPYRSTRIGLTEIYVRFNLAVDWDLAQFNPRNSIFLGIRAEYILSTKFNYWGGDFVYLKVKRPKVYMGGPGIRLLIGITGVLRD
jgi:hypothetical protein